MNDESWREGPPRALQLMVFQQTYDMMFNMVLKQVEVPAHVTLENVSDWLGWDKGAEVGVKYTVMSVGTEDVFEVLYIHDEIVVSNVTSIVY